MLIYNVFLYVFFIPLSVILVFISIFNSRIRKTLKYRFFINIKKSDEKRVWFHCSSLGEFNAIKNVILKVEKKIPNIFITVLTDTGYEAAVKLFGKERVAILPLDLKFLIKRLIKRINPAILIIEETELWPNMIYQANKQDIPIIYANAIISDRSFKSYKKFAFIFAKVIKSIELFFVQNKTTAEYLKYFGIREERIKYIGNVKFDIKLDFDKDPEELKKIYYLEENKILTCGSIREGEEEILIKAFGVIKKKLSNIKLIMVPRHLDRIQDIIKIIERYSLGYSLLSELKKAYDILIVDKMGVLLDFYAVSDISFIGGTMVPIGGHNPLEAAVFGKPVIFGKYIKNNEQAFLELSKNNAGIMVHNEAELTDMLIKLFKESRLRESMGRNAVLVMEKNRGAADKIAEVILNKVIGKV